MKLKPSNAHIWTNCPGSTRLKTWEDAKPRVTTEGTLCHKLAELIGTGAIRAASTLDEINTREDVAALGLPVTDELLDIANQAALFCMERPQTTRIREQYLRANGLPGGCVDFAAYEKSFKILHIVDFKFGYVPVSPVENWQLICYAALMIEGGYVYRPKKLELHIVQPRDYITGEKFKTWHLSAPQYLQWLTTLRTRIADAERGENLSTGDHCRYCRSRTFCPAFLAGAAALAETHCRNVEDVSREALAAEYLYLQRAEKMVVAARGALEDRILYEIENGNPVDGLTVEQGKGRRVWSADLATLEAAGDMAGAALTKKTSVSLSEAWKNKTVRPFLKNLTTTTAGRKKLVRLDRDAIKRRFENA